MMSDKNKVIQLWCDGAIRSDSSAMNNLGMCFEKGFNFEQDKRRAFILYETHITLVYVTSMVVKQKRRKRLNCMNEPPSWVIQMQCLLYKGVMELNGMKENRWNFLKQQVSVVILKRCAILVND